MSTASQPVYQIESDNESIVIRISRGSVSEQSIVQFLNGLELGAIRQRSQMAEEDAQQLADEVKQAAWDRVKQLFQGG